VTVTEPSAYCFSPLATVGQSSATYAQLFWQVHAGLFIQIIQPMRRTLIGVALEEDIRGAVQRAPPSRAGLRILLA
jgi:hypothetical protein